MENENENVADDIVKERKATEFWKRLFWQFIGGAVLTGISLILIQINSNSQRLEIEQKKSELEQKVDNLQRNIWHKSETDHAFKISALKQSAVILEEEMLLLRQEKQTMIECIRRDNCHKFPNLLTMREMKKYKSPSEIYENIQLDLDKSFDDIDNTNKPIEEIKNDATQPNN